VRLGGVLLGCFGIVIVVLVANGRWDTVWAAATGQIGTSTAAGSSNVTNAAAYNAVSNTVLGNQATATYSGTMAGA
jgi:hypothetical protein